MKMTENTGAGNGGMIMNERPETSLMTSDFYYDLPKELIAQSPSEVRDLCRLMVLDRASGETQDLVFRDVKRYLRPEDVLVVNSSRVIPARLIGRSPSGGEVEYLLLRALDGGKWECIVRPGKRARAGSSADFSGILSGYVNEVREDGNRIVSFTYDTGKYGSIYEVLDVVGNMPLPPYITKKLEDKEDYQTVYAKERGSAAAPTAGLHFTKELLSEIRGMGVGYAEVTLHVGLGTFRPVKCDRIEEHHMHGEFFHITPEAADIINTRRRSGGRIIAVGTTSCRVLESAADENGRIIPMSAETGIFIYPGYRFRATDALITNFHLPESTLLMLVSAFSDRETILRAYRHAVEEKYRFFSFGDAMLII